MEKKYFNRKTMFSLIWLGEILGWGWIVALVLFLTGKADLDLEDKREVVSCFVCAIVNALLGWTIVLPLYVFVCEIIACVKAFKGDTFQIPGAYQIAKAIIK